MSVRVEYKCNVCNEIIDREQLRCIYYNSVLQNEDESFGRYTIISNVTATDKHICLNCIKMINEYSND